jgi:nicrotizing toxin Mtb-like protein
MAGPPGAPPPAKGERNEVLAAFWLHMFPIGHLPVASYRPARQLPAPPPELDYAAGLRFEPGDHPDFHLLDDRPRLTELHEGIAHRAAAKAAANSAPIPLPPSTPAGYVSTPLPHAYAPPQATPAPAPSPEPVTIPRFRPVTPSAGITADHPVVQSLLENHDPLGDTNERDWDRRYLVRLGSVTPQGISPEGLEYNWPTSEQYPEGGSAPGEPETLPADTVIDRFGDPHGRVFAADGTAFAQRSLPAPHKDTGYRRYRVVRALPVWRAVSAAWFAQPGGGVRYRTTHSAVELVALGYLEEIA